ncbi:MAG: universal stress protein [Actinomycetia bacterium]|nr:universal stress protein [Actinomycetes bacterium]MCP4958098.1 universal stress protein [Actinomycetes bacterium]
MKILACVDFTPAADAVVDVVGNLASSSTTTVTLLHVAAPEPAFVGYDDEGGPRSREDRERQLDHERVRIGQQAAILAQRGVETAETVMRVGATTDTILEVADEIDADVVVVGRHRHGRLHDLLLGNTATEVVERSRRPVLIVPPRDD